jgi:hypothetical protein
MHAVAKYALINQRMLFVEMREREEQTKSGTRAKKAPSSFFMLRPKFKSERGGNKFPSEALY